MRRLVKLFAYSCGFAVIVAVVAAIILSGETFGAAAEGELLARIRKNPNFKNGAFVNDVPQAPFAMSDVPAYVKGQFFYDEVRTPPKPLPVNQLKRADLELSTKPALKAFWIGHASVYVEIDGLRVLTDPVFSEYASPFGFGPRRFQAPPIALADLPRIDAVVISHDHYDHLDMETVKHLAAKGTHFYVPLGVGAHLKRWGIQSNQIHDMEWGQQLSIKGVRIICTPARHYSGRGLSDYKSKLWSSWSVLGPVHRFYYSGDTGYSPHFKRTGAEHGPFDLGIIKIGAYGPGQSWLDIHMTAEDAVLASKDVRARKLLPVHWATFNLANHDWDEPIKRALKAAQKENVRVLTPRIGELVNIASDNPQEAWWGR